MGNEHFAEVIVDLSHEKLDKPFTYRIPEELIPFAVPGSPVFVPFGASNRRTRGYILNLTDGPRDGWDSSRVKAIDSIPERGLNAEDEFLELAAWMKERYGCTMNKALKTVLPVRSRIKARTLTDPVREGRREYTLHEANPAQKEALDTFIRHYDAGERKSYLLYGVTGSGKTDTYIHMMRHVIASGKQVILLIPEISLTYQTIDRLYAVFGSRVAIIHSRLSPGERSEQMLRCQNGEADIMVGPRSAIFAPFRSIGLIVIDEEHDGAYKNETIPRYHAIDVARKRAEMQQASLLLCSATPSPESYQNALRGEYVLLTLPQRVPGAGKPDLRLVDMRQEMQQGNRSIFSRELDRLIRDRLEKKEQIILFMNRRGYSNFVSCRSCGNAVRCPHCDVSMTLHRGHHLVCHYCGYTCEQPQTCPSCGSHYIAEFGTGTQKLETLTRKQYPGARVARMDTDSTTGKEATGQILRNMANGEIDILIGTQMVVKGHDYPNVTLVGIMAAETSLYVSRYDSGQRTFELIAQASGRAGRGGKPGTVVIQTYKPEHYAIAAAAGDDYAGYFRKEMQYRKALHYPPAIHILTIQFSSADEALLREQTSRCGDILQALSDRYGGEMIGPVEASVFKINDYFRMLAYLKHKDYDILLKIKEEGEILFATSGITVSLQYDFT